MSEITTSKNIFISVVGSHDPTSLNKETNEISEGALLTILRESIYPKNLDQNNASQSKSPIDCYVILWHESKPKESDEEKTYQQRAKECVDFIQQQHLNQGWNPPEIYLKEFNADLQDIYSCQTEFLKILNNLFPELHNCQTFINVTSGAIGAQAAFYTLASWNRLGKPRLFTSREKRFGDPRTSERNLYPFAAQDALQRFRQSIANDRLATAAADIKELQDGSNLMSSETRMQFRQLNEVLTEWHKFEANGKEKVAEQASSSRLKGELKNSLKPLTLTSKNKSLWRAVAKYGAASRAHAAEDFGACGSKARVALDHLLTFILESLRGNKIDGKFFLETKKSDLAIGNKLAILFESFEKCPHFTSQINIDFEGWSKSVTVNKNYFHSLIKEIGYELVKDIEGNVKIKDTKSGLARLLNTSPDIHGGEEWNSHKSTAALNGIKRVFGQALAENPEVGPSPYDSPFGQKTALDIQDAVENGVTAELYSSKQERTMP